MLQKVPIIHLSISVRGIDFIDAQSTVRILLLLDGGIVYFAEWLFKMPLRQIILLTFYCNSWFLAQTVSYATIVIYIYIYNFKVISSLLYIVICFVLFSITFRFQSIISSYDIRYISYCAQDPDDLSVFAYITKDAGNAKHYCHVFKASNIVSFPANYC